MNIARLLTQSGHSKAGYLSDWAELKNSLFVGVCETWLSPEIVDAEVTHDFSGYTIMRSDRISRQGGGVALYLSDSLSGDVISSFDNGVCEALVVMIHQINTCVCVCYRPPDTRLSEFSEMIQSVDSALSALPNPTPNIIVMGDMNFPRTCIKWEKSEEGNLFPLVAGHRQEETLDGKQDRLQAHHLVQFAARHFLQQEVEGPTHAAECLDLIWTNNWDLVSSCEREDCGKFSDHKLITANTTYKINNEDADLEEQFLCETGRRYKILDFHKAPWEQVEADLEKVDWSQMEDLANTSPEAALKWFHEKVLHVLEVHVPNRKQRKGISFKKMPRMRRLLWRKLTKVNSKLKKAATMHQKAKLLQVKWDIEQELKDDYEAVNNAEEDEAVFRIKQNPKAFFSFARGRQNTRSKVGPFMDPGSGKPNSSPDYCCEALQQQYNSVFSPPRPMWKVQDFGEHFQHEEGDRSALSDIEFSSADIEKACQQLKSSSAPGPDGVPAVLLKTCRKQLSLPLFYLWRGSLDCGVIPAETLLVIICPIHKGGSRSIPKQYRPVALTSHLIKVFERVLREALVAHIDMNNLLPNGQHGSRATRSTLTQLLSQWDVILAGLEEGDGVDSVYLDFSKAFDKVETGVLLHKLKDSKVLGKIGVWLARFLDSAQRQQAVAVEGRLSGLSPVISGVPQGTVLGPILFLLHISCIAREVSAGSNVSSYVDDTRVTRSIVNQSDCTTLQDDLDAIYRWALDVNMVFNGDKFEMLRFWPNKEKPATPYIDPEGNIIEEKEHLRDLGVELSSDLTFSRHIENIVSDASRLVGWIMRTFRRRSKGVMITLWKSLIQSRLDYCSQLWSPSDQASISKLEGVAKSFTSRVSGTEGLDYWERLSMLRMYSQERRRERYQIIFIWKLSQGLVVGYSLPFQHSDRRGRTVPVPQIVSESAAAVKKAREVFQVQYHLHVLHNRNAHPCMLVCRQHEVPFILPFYDDHCDGRLGAIQSCYCQYGHLFLIR